jgi:hypothetical protein
MRLVAGRNLQNRSLDLLKIARFEIISKRGQYAPARPEKRLPVRMDVGHPPW